MSSLGLDDGNLHGGKGRGTSAEDREPLRRRHIFPKAGQRRERELEAKLGEMEAKKQRLKANLAKAVEENEELEQDNTQLEDDNKHLERAFDQARKDGEAKDDLITHLRAKNKSLKNDLADEQAENA